jgi:hypothetical protein
VNYSLPPSVFIPDSFGRYGYYRGANVAEWANLPPKYSAGASECAACHGARYELWSEGKHASVNCETCHGAAEKHIRARRGPVTVITQPEEVPSLAIEDPRGLCILCHDGRVPGRPKDFPQVDVPRHAGEASCTLCHNPHSPWPPGVGR